jgi:hypothetical protein
MPSALIGAQSLMMRRSSGSRLALTSLSTLTTTCWWGALSMNCSILASVPSIDRLSTWQPIIVIRSLMPAPQAALPSSRKRIVSRHSTATAHDYDVILSIAGCFGLVARSTQW